MSTKVDEARMRYMDARLTWAAGCSAPSPDAAARWTEMTAALDALIAAVREECAAVADEYGAARLPSARNPLDSERYESILANVAAHNIAARIRARGAKR